MVNKFKIIAKVMIIFYIIPSERTIYLDTQTQRILYHTYKQKNNHNITKWYFNNDSLTLGNKIKIEIFD